MKEKTFRNTSWTYIQMIVLFLLRVTIGWHFLYEGIAKIFTPGWSSSSYLEVSRWFLSGFFQWIAAHPVILKIVDVINIGGLMLIGLALILGCFTRIACLGGMALLVLYYIANPPLAGLDFGSLAEGSYLIVNKNMVEFFALFLLAVFPTYRLWSLDRLFRRIRKIRALSAPRPAENLPNDSPKEAAQEERTTHDTAPAPAPSLKRREIIKNLAALPVLGGFAVAVLKKQGWESHEEKLLEDHVDATTQATVRGFNFASLKDLKGTVPGARIGNLTISRMIMGGNLIGGWAHARDLIYASKLVKTYHTKDKIFETMLLAEKCGINTILTNPVLSGVIRDYWERKIGKIQFISDCSYRGDLFKGIQVSVDNGAHSCYVQGGIADALVREGKIDQIARALEVIREKGIPAGIGAHELETVKACVDHGLVPDYWVKTLHHIDYWSAKPQEQHDNIWCTDPEATIAYMKELKQPWIAYKVLAAGAIQPEIGFKYAFENGADFICVGMYDFQIVDDVNIAHSLLSETLVRQRPWMA